MAMTERRAILIVIKDMLVVCDVKRAFVLSVYIFILRVVK